MATHHPFVTGLSAVGSAVLGLTSNLPELYFVCVLGGGLGGTVRWLIPSTGIEPFYPLGLRVIVLGFLLAALFTPFALPLFQQWMEVKLQLTPFAAAIGGGGLTGLFGVSFIQYVFDDLAARKARRKGD